MPPLSCTFVMRSVLLIRSTQIHAHCHAISAPVMLNTNPYTCLPTFTCPAHCHVISESNVLDTNTQFCTLTFHIIILIIMRLVLPRFDNWSIKTVSQHSHCHTHCHEISDSLIHTTVHRHYHCHAHSMCSTLTHNSIHWPFTLSYSLSCV
jgi:hypothetical protein